MIVSETGQFGVAWTDAASTAVGVAAVLDDACVAGFSEASVSNQTFSGSVSGTLRRMRSQLKRVESADDSAVARPAPAASAVSSLLVGCCCACSAVSSDCFVSRMSSCSATLPGAER